MKNKNILLLYISEHSGHHCASIAIERELSAQDPSVKILNLNSFNYTNPILEKIINRAYMSVVKTRPEIWDYLYDNPKVLKRTQILRDLMHRFNTEKLKVLLEDFKPCAVICTQAFPCGMIADYKKTWMIDVPLVGVLTDYAPHSYWVYDNVDRYVVPSLSSKEKLIRDGIDPSKISVFGIPIESRFGNSVNKAAVFSKIGFREDVPTVLIMGGTQGLGPIKDLVRLLDRSTIDIQTIVACGSNKRLYGWMSRYLRQARKKIAAFPFIDNINEFMSIAKVIITKPGGITTAEALTKGLPMLIVHPLPGQEAMNTRFLLENGAAVRAETITDTVVLLEELLYNQDKLKMMSDKALSLANPQSARNIASLTLGLCNR